MQLRVALRKLHMVNPCFFAFQKNTAEILMAYQQRAQICEWFMRWSANNKIMVEHKRLTIKMTAPLQMNLDTLIRPCICLLPPACTHKHTTVNAATSTAVLAEMWNWYLMICAGISYLQLENPFSRGDLHHTVYVNLLYRSYSCSSKWLVIKLFYSKTPVDYLLLHNMLNIVFNKMNKN